MPHRLTPTATLEAALSRDAATGSAATTAAGVTVDLAMSGGDGRPRERVS